MQSFNQADRQAPDAAAAGAATSSQEVPGVDQPGDLNPIEAQTMIDDVTIGKRVEGDGMIAVDEQGDDFAPGDPVYIAMRLDDTPAGSAVKVYWYGPDETKIADESKSVTQGQQYLTFELTETGSLQKGDYRAEVWIGDEKVNQQHFQIVDHSDAGR